MNGPISVQRSLYMLLTVLAGTITSLLAQTPSARAVISGTVLDETTGRPMEYVNVVLDSAADSTLVTGAVTNSQGAFQLINVPAGSYHIAFRFMGYETKSIDNLAVGEAPVDVGEIVLVPTTIGVGGVVVEGARPTVTYQIDKKVIDVDQLSTTISGTAADVLTNVPSVSVDIEGNVSLRGSGNLTVLIDGKPSVLDAQDALQQIPASTIGSIEIITNPSAKHDPEGTAGIINIKMKQQRGRGWSGLVNANVGLNDKYGGDMLFEHKDGSLSTLIGIDYNNRLHPMTSRGEERYEYQGNTSIIESSGEMRMRRNMFGLRGALEFGVGENGSATLTGRYGTREWQRNSTLQHDAWSLPAVQPVSSQNIVFRKRSGDFYALNAGYHYAFGPEGHKLTSDFMFRYRDSDELTTSELIGGQGVANGKKTTEAGPSRDVEGRIDYVLPFGETNRFEAGYQGEIDIDEEATSLSEHDSASGRYVLLPQFSHVVKYKDNEHALYSLYSGEWSAFGYQAGLRSEYTHRTVRLALGEFLIDRWDFFPTLHFSYKFSGGDQVMASYTRRIDRPRGWELEPFETWVDANNVRRGNPSLLPEFIDSYELAVQTLFGKTSFSVEVYHRAGHNKIENIRSVYADNVTLTTVENVGTEFSSGTELLANFDVANDWNVNLIANAYDYRIEGKLFGESFSTRSFNWSARLNNIVKLQPSTQIQVNAMWNSPSVSPQGRREGFISVDVAAKQEFLDRQLSLTLQVQNVLNTARHEFTSEGSGFYSYNHHTMESPMLMLTARFSINNYRPERDRDREEGFGEEEF